MLVQAISAGALYAVRSNIVLQSVLVGVIAGVSIAIGVLVFWLIIYLVHKNPAYLFNPQDINPTAHDALYALNLDNIEVRIEGKEK